MESIDGSPFLLAITILPIRAKFIRRRAKQPDLMPICFIQDVDHMLPCFGLEFVPRDLMMGRLLEEERYEDLARIRDGNWGSREFFYHVLLQNDPMDMGQFMELVELCAWKDGGRPDRKGLT